MEFGSYRLCLHLHSYIMESIAYFTSNSITQVRKLLNTVKKTLKNDTTSRHFTQSQEWSLIEEENVCVKACCYIDMKQLCVCVTSACLSVHLNLFCVCFSGGQCDRMQVACNSQQDLQDWLDLLTKHTHTSAAHTHLHKPQSVCHTVSHN